VTGGGRGLDIIIIIIRRIALILILKIAEYEGMDWIRLAQDRDQWRTLWTR
jgi:hypothetical protein